MNGSPPFPPPDPTDPRAMQAYANMLQAQADFYRLQQPRQLPALAPLPPAPAPEPPAVPPAQAPQKPAKRLSNSSETRRGTSEWMVLVLLAIALAAGFMCGRAERRVSTNQYAE